MTHLTIDDLAKIGKTYQVKLYDYSGRQYEEVILRCVAEPEPGEHSTCHGCYGDFTVVDDDGDGTHNYCGDMPGGCGTTGGIFIPECERSKAIYVTAILEGRVSS